MGASATSSRRCQRKRLARTRRTLHTAASVVSPIDEQWPPPPPTELNLQTSGPAMRMHNHIELRSSPLHGTGLFVIKPIRAGEVVWYDEKCAYPGMDQLIPISFIMDLEPSVAQEVVHFAYQVSETMMWAEKGFEEGASREASSDASDYTNHSCDPTTIFYGNAGTMIAARDLEPGDEITYDYATSETIHWPWEGDGMTCKCGSKLCRGTIRHDDWRRPELHERYGRKGFVPFIWDMIERERKATPSAGAAQ